MTPELVDALELTQWAERLEARGMLPHVVRRLLAASTGVTAVDMPAEEAIVTPGFDGVVDGGTGNAWVPSGRSVWEIGVGQDPRAKAQKDYDKRTEDPKGVLPGDTAFVFVTPRSFPGGREWANDREAEGVWRQVQVLDANRLHGWLESLPDVHVWLSERLGKQPLDVRTLGGHWDRMAAGTDPRLPPELLLAGRQSQVDALREALGRAPSVISVRAASRKEASAFVAAALGLADLDGDVAPEQPLWVRTGAAFDRLVLSTRPLTLVASPEEIDAGHAAACGHHVILTLGAGDYERDGVITLPRPDRSAARTALEEAGVKFDRADRLAGLARRGFAALMRELAVARGGKPPSWAIGEDAPMLAALALLGGWGSGEGDDQAIEAVTGLKRAEVERRLLALSRAEDPPWTRSAGAWRLVSPEDCSALVGELLDRQVLDRWSSCALNVLGDPDPRADMDMGQRLMADLKDEAHPRYSESLRRGIAQATALLGARSTERLSSGVVGADYAALMVRDVLKAANNDPTGAAWARIAELLPLLGEGAPGELLDAVEDGLAIEPSPILSLFQDGPGFSALFSRSPHSGLLWALEGIAWSPDHLPRVALILGELAEREPGGQMSNRPAQSLREIFLPWHPQTSAESATRLRTIDDLRARRPSAAWKLLLALLPRLNATAAYTHRPRYRDADEATVTRDGMADEYHQLAIRVGADAGTDTERWTSLVEHLYALSSADRDELLGLMEALDVAVIPDDQRLVLWRALIDEAERHLSFQEAGWALPETDARAFLRVAEHFAVDAAPQRFARLFSYRARSSAAPRDDYEAQRHAVEAERRAAAEEVARSDGVAGLLRLAEEAELPRVVGFCAAGGGEELASELLPLLGTNGSGAELAAGWVAGRVAADGIAWGAETLSGGDLKIAGRVALLLELPHGDETWDLVAAQGPEVEGRYWTSARPYGLHGEQAKRATEHLLKFNRPWAAVDLLAGTLFEGRPVEDPELFARVLEQAAQSDDVDAAVNAGWAVVQMLDALERAEFDVARLAGLEFVFFGLVEDQREPRALPIVVARDPLVFVQLVCRAHRRDDGAEEVDRQADAAGHAWRVLNGLRRLPGQDDEGQLDSAVLGNWVDDVRRELAVVGRADRADAVLGQLLAFAPNGTDGAWPAEAVRDVIERLNSARLDENLRIGRLARRGPTYRGVYQDGAGERRLAAGLRDEAAQLQARWPRTARIARAMAKDYESEARHHDLSAEYSADED